MKRLSATILLSIGLVFAAITAFAGPAGASTTTMKDCYPGGSLQGCSAPHHSVPVTPHDPTTHHATSTPVATTPTPTTPTPATPVVDSQPVASGSLAFTGVDAAGIALVGLALIGGGIIVVRTSRRRTLA
jgi:hypothetical protein